MIRFSRPAPSSARVTVCTGGGRDYEASLLEAIRKLYQERNKYIAAMSAGKNLNSIQHIVNLIEECIHS